MASEPTKGQNVTRLMLVEDHPIVRYGLKRMLDREADLEVCAEAESAQEALSKLEECQPHLALIDLALKNSSGLELLEAFKKNAPHIPTVMISVHQDASLAERALRAGAMGYILKDESVQEIIAAIRQVLQGTVYVSPQVASLLLSQTFGGHQSDETEPIKRLSNREFEVFRLLGEGLKTKDIASRLHLSPKTVETHFARIKAKLQLNDARELLQSALRWNIENKQVTNPTHEA